jgi:hypothetical protein
VSWEVTPLDAPVEDWLIAPILYFNGHEFPAFDDDQLARLVRYVEQGGTLLAEACCSRAEFRAGFTAFARRAFPEYELVRLSPDHPVFNAPYALDGAAIELHGINLGCRTSVIFSPHDLSCLWEQGDVPELSERAFQLGTNIAAYPTGQDPLPDKLDAARLVRRVLSDTDAPPPRGAVYIAQLMHNGDWRPNPKAIPNLADHLRRSVGADVVGRSKPLRATDPGLARHPIVYMTGHFSFELSPGETDALRLHLQRGGFLLATACCGRPAFDASFRELARELFPDHPLVPLPADHPILAGNPGVPLADVTYRPSTLAARPGLTGPRLEGVTLDGRAVLVYSPFSLDCGLDGHACHACLGLEPADARRVAGNAVAYALSY